MQTKKLVVGILTTILSLPAMAEIANNATCNNTNLGQSDNNSTANVEANWNANTININWYNGDTKITSNTCTYDGQITLPAQPSKPGYTFAGWRLRGAPTITIEDCDNDEDTCYQCVELFPEQNFAGWGQVSEYTPGVGYQSSGYYCCRRGDGCTFGVN